MTPDQVKSLYRRLMRQRGEPIIVRRYTGVGLSKPKFEATVTAVVQDYTAEELVGAIQQGDRRVIVLVEDLVAAQFSLPLTSADKVEIRQRECAVFAPDDSTIRVRGVLVAYNLRVRG